MASLPRSQPAELSQGRTSGFGGPNTAPMNDLPVTVVVDTQVGGMHGDAAGSVSASNRTPEPD